MEIIFQIGILVFIFNLTYESVINGSMKFPENDQLFENSECKTQDNLWGVCTKASLCPQFKFNISATKICSFHGKEAIICCVRSSELACYGYQVNNGDLIKKTVQLIYNGGWQRKSRKHQHMAAIGWSQKSTISWKCGGSLVSNKFLLTVAHCITTPEVLPDIVRAGVVNLVNNDPPPIDYKIIDIIIHPDYKPPTIYHDIALLQILPHTFLTSTILSSICLWPSKKIPEIELTAMGYGTTVFNGPNSDHLLVSTLLCIPQDQCISAYQSNPDKRYRNGILDSQICAHDPQGIRDTCQGDSGGPLQFKEDNSTVYIVGITSYGEGCAGPRPGVYTRVESYIAWIENIVWPEFSEMNLIK